MSLSWEIVADTRVKSWGLGAKQRVLICERAGCGGDDFGIFVIRGSVLDKKRRWQVLLRVIVAQGLCRLSLCGTRASVVAQIQPGHVAVHGLLASLGVVDLFRAVGVVSTGHAAREHGQSAITIICHTSVAESSWGPQLVAQVALGIC